MTIISDAFSFPYVGSHSTAQVQIRGYGAFLFAVSSSPSTDDLLVGTSRNIEV